MNSIFLVVVMLLPVLCSVLFSVLFFRRQKKKRRNPLTMKLLRGPGESLREELEKNIDRLENAYLRMLFVGLPPLGLIWLFGLFQEQRVEFWQIGLALVFYAGLIVWGAKKLYAVLKVRRNILLGLDAELAVGQELNQLMLKGCRVYHDFPAENFNIDHVVVGPGGVYAIETKGRAKPDLGRGSEDATVVFDGQGLVFPDWQEVKPLEQAKRQAGWLSRWLSSAIGVSVPVVPVLVLPGWYVKQTGPSEVKVFNGKKPEFLARPVKGVMLTEQEIQQVAHQLEQRCRNLEPVAYRKQQKSFTA